MSDRGWVPDHRSLWPDGARAGVTPEAGRRRPSATFRRPTVIIALAVIGVATLAALVPGALSPYEAWDCTLARSLQPPSRSHLFGVDLQGCDYLTRVIHGARASLVVGVAATAAAATIGLVLGTSAGYVGGRLDTIISRFTDVWFAVPTLLGAMVLLSVTRAPGTIGVTAVIALFAWPIMFRLHRASILVTRVRGHVEAARGLGAGHTHIIIRHLLPHAMPSMLAYATLFAGVAITAEATLTYLGLGLQLPAISWGLMISTAQRRVLEHPHLLVFPGAALISVVASLVVVGDALRAVVAGPTQ